MKRVAILAATFATLLLGAPASASAFGFLPGSAGFDAVARKASGVPETQAGAHPDVFRASFGFQGAGGHADGDLADLHLELPPGFLVNPTAVPECSQVQFGTPRVSPYEASLSGEGCLASTQVGTITVKGALGTRTFGLFNLSAPYGHPGAFGASPFGVPMIFTSQVREADAGLTLDLEGLAQAFDLQGLELEIWGTPWALENDGKRVNCLNEEDPAAYHGELSHYETEIVGGEEVKVFVAGTCTLGTPEFLAEFAKSYLTLPTTPCGSPLELKAQASSWQSGSDQATAPTTLTLSGCNKHLTIPKLALSTDQTAVGTGLAFELDVNDGGGILNPEGIARPAVKQAVVSLPEGLTINPSLGAGLGVCTEAQFAREAVDSAPGAGCPNDSKIGDIRVEGMLGLPEDLTGSLFVAKPYVNPYGELIALYITARNERRGLFARSVGKVVPDPATGRLTATFDQLPRLLYTHFELRFREGQRAAMVSPTTCGRYPTEARLSSWADPDTFSLDTTSYFLIDHGRGGGSCSAGVPPFYPDLEAGSLNSTASFYTPFYLHMTRSDAEQEITSYSATFPPGLLAKIAGIPYCPEAAIAASGQRTGIAEAQDPSCPAASSIGRTLAGYGVGGVLAYAPGGLYLAGPWNGSPLSVVAIDSALVGPFDLGVVVVRSAIRVDPRTAQVSIDSLGSDPIPHMLKGIPLHLRDIRVHVDRPGFTVNPTSCDELQTLSTLTGAAADLASRGDDSLATSSDRFQASDCQALGFKPRLRIKLLGSRRRGGYPALRAVLTERAGDANLGTATVTLPPTQFLAQNHIRGICSAQQFERGACPADSIYGRARAFSPLLAEPLEGPVYLRSSPNPLPDMVVALRGAGGIEIEVVGRISSKRGAMRASFDVLPDAPASLFVMTLKGGKRGLLQNSESLCKRSSYASALFTGHNNAVSAGRVRLGNQCSKGGEGRPGGHARRALP